MSEEKTKSRTDYHREYYKRRAEQLAERKQNERDRFEYCVSYWRQLLGFGRDIPGLKSGCSEEMVEKARKHYLKIQKQPVKAEIRMLR